MALKTSTTWTTARGEELELHEIEDDHLVNIIGVLQRRRKSMEEIAEEHDSKNVGKSIKEIKRQIDIFIDELDRRKKLFK